ncbi:MAG: DUF308 domain-containing protein [Hyphomicrobiales bacterium]|nr:DUF308 domain-containing protein [Hyphomicrobiales bacterium]
MPQSAPGARPHNLGEAIHRIRGKWGWFVAFGLLAAVMGAAILLYLVVEGTIASVFMIAIAMIVTGGAEIGLGLNARSWGRTAMWIVVGLLYIVAGAFALAQPMLAAAGYTLLIGVALLVVGVARIIAALRLDHGPKALIILSGLVGVLLGGMIIASWPASSLFVLGTFLGIDLFFYGLTWIAFGMRLKSA